VVRSFDISTIRKLQHFGNNGNGVVPFDFEWPTKSEDIQPAADGQPVRVVAIEWQRSAYDKIFIGGIQLVLSNGQKSPLFLAKDQQQKKLQRVDIDFTVNKIRGTVNNWNVRQLQFSNMDNTRSA